jgi:hypothetical protein
MAQEGVIIDSFETSHPFTVAFPGTPAYSLSDGAGIMGGERDVEIGSNGPSILYTQGTRDGCQEHNQASGTTGTTLISWDGNDNDPQGLNFDLRANLTAGGGDRLYVRVRSTSQAGGILRIRVYTDADNWSQHIIGNMRDIDPPGATYYAPYRGFGQGGSGPADFGQVGAITLEIDGSASPALDMGIDAIGYVAPTAIDLASFTATQQDGTVVLDWETVTEVDNLGFNLYRAEAPDGQRLRLNGTLIPGQAPGSPVGGSYQFVDEAVRPGVTYYYWLEDLDLSGVTTQHGPVSVRLLFEDRILPGRPRPAAAIRSFGR